MRRRSRNQPRWWAGRVAAALTVVCAAAAAGAQPGYEEYADWEGWARLRRMEQTGLASSYDRTGENEDYSHYEYPPGLVLDPVTCTVKTLQGPGVIRRFWMPHLTANRSFVVRMYFDNEPTPRIDTTSDILLNEGFSYFTSPLVTTCAGGQVSYEPIPFADALRIETVNKTLPPDNWSANRHYYQYTYTLLASDADVASYTGVLTPEQEAMRAVVAAQFDNVGQHPAGANPAALSVTTGAASILAGECLTLADLAGPGVIRQVSVALGTATDAELDGLSLRISYDSDATPAIEVAVSDLFGAGYQRAPYRSLPLGTNSPDGFYCYWPLPFRSAVKVELCNTTALPIALERAVVEYQLQPVSAFMGYLHAQSVHHVREDGDVYHTLLDVAGRGHYVGCLLYAGQDKYSMQMLEGDDLILVDGTPQLLGTGLEDAFNGGYYYNWVVSQPGEPEGECPISATRPLHGILHVHREEGIQYSRADQYRWLIADRVPFLSSIAVKIENRYAVVGGRWTSVAFWYQQPDIPGDTEADGDLDLIDFAHLQRCYGSTDSACLNFFDHDTDGTVDLDDYDSLLSSFSGPW